MTVESPTLSCPRCEAAVSADAQFCASCGLALGEPSETDEARHARLTAAAPSPLIEKMRAAKLSGERKPVTALFADVVGSTALAERMDPEDWAAMMNEAFDHMSKAVFHYEGTIAQLQGDAMLAFFGAPIAHEDDPDRAVHAALGMIAATEEFSRQLRATHGLDFRIRVGINSGPVVVGNVGSDLRYEYTALGDAMNVAARMQAAAGPGTVLITAATHRFVADAFDAEDLGEIVVKGKAEPVHAYRVLAPKVVPDRKRGLERAGIASPMVGRESQLETLRSLYGVVSAGRGRVAFLVGEPGIGKSRLLAEFQRYAKGGRAADGPAAALDSDAPAARDGDARPTWIEGRCVSYGRNLPYHLVLDLVRFTLRLPFVASESEARATLDHELSELLGDEGADTAPFLAHLLGLPLHPAEASKALIDPETMQIRYIASIHRLLRALSERGPVVMVCEDVHWADPSSVELMRQVLPMAAELPVFLIASLRAETDSAGWKLMAAARELFGAALTEIRLEPLSATESRDLVANLLEIESLPDRVRDLILARAEGNPFFVEEVIRMLIEHGVIERRADRWIATGEVGSVEIPETLHGLLLARIDQLPDAAKRSLRVASVIGRQFPVRVLERVLGETSA
jgi:class 3 adenylate cyclase